MTCVAGFASAALDPVRGSRLFGSPPGSSGASGEPGVLFARAAYFGSPGALALVVSMDCLWIPPQVALDLRQRIACAHGLPAEAVLVAATHAHATPQPHPGIRDGHPHDETFAELILKQGEQAARLAVASAVPARLGVTSTRVDVTVNRRRAIVAPGSLLRGRLRRVVANRPNPDAPVDDTLTVLRATAEDDGRTLGLLVNLACHPTVGGRGEVSADYPGALARAIQDGSGDQVVAVFLQGFTGDQRPNLTRRSAFDIRHPWRSLYSLAFDRVVFAKDNQPEVVEAFAARIAQALAAAGPDRSAGCEVRAAQGRISLPVENGGPDVELRSQCLALQGLTIAALDAEVFSGYGLWLRSRFGDEGEVMPVGCAGGMVGYIPDAQALKEGGYEPDRSLSLFGLSSRFAPDVQDALRRGLDALVRSCRKQVEKQDT